EEPFATLEKARDVIRELRQQDGIGAGGAMAIVRGGTYRVTRSFTLTAEDSGTAAAPLRFTVAEGETAIFSGGVRLEGFEPVTDEAVLARLPEEARGHVLQCSLAPLGLGALPPLRLGGFSSG